MTLVNPGTNKKTLRVTWKTLAQLQRDWRLSNEDLGQALGGLAPEFITRQLKGSIDTISDDVVLRASHMMNIHSALHALFEVKTQANTWVDRPNTAELFEGRPPRELIVSGDMKMLANIHVYLFGFCG